MGADRPRGKRLHRISLEGRKELDQASVAKPKQSDEEKLQCKLRERVDKYLDEGHGSCLFKKPKLATIVEDALNFFHEQRYLLHAWAVMPNHSHAVVEPGSDIDLSEITHSWKSFTSHEVNKLLNRNGNIWHKESFDRIIRNQKE